jgi:glutaredoxin
MEPFLEPASSKFTVYSKSGCPNCVKAKTLLKERGLPFITVDCDEYILENKAEFLQFIEKKALTSWKTFPIIFDGILDGSFVGMKFVGGFTELKVYLNKELDFTTEF